MQFDDGAIDAGGQSKVVGIEDEAAHRLSVSTLGAVTPKRVGCSPARLADRQASALV
jgi:hypothetical protein